MIITNKQFPNYKKYEIEYEGRTLSMEVGKLAELCNAAVLVKYGETTVLVTCTASARPKDGIDYFPLSVDFNEKLYAVGRIPGSFMRREGKPSLPAVLASRLIDRPMRPLFPSDLRNDVVIACEVLSVDRDCSPEITAMIGASAAVSISDVPFNGPIAGIVLGWDGKKYLFNPTEEERKTNRMITTIAATHKKIVMIESEADQVPDEVMYEGIVQAHEHLQPVLDLIDTMVREIGKPKFEYEHASFDEEPSAARSYHTGAHAPSGDLGNMNVPRRQYANNMCVVADVKRDKTVLNSENYIIASFVGDECRGISSLVGDKYFITVYGNSGGLVNYQVFDLTGRMVMSQNIGRVAEGVNEFSINTENLSTGSYILRLNQGANSSCVKFMVY